MEDKYSRFFSRIDKAYGEPGGYSHVCELLSKRDFRYGMDEKSYKIARTVLLEFFSKHNTGGGDRIFGLPPFEISELVRECRERESNKSLQAI